MNDATTKAPDKWVNFGTILDINSSVLYGVKAQHDSDSIACYRNVFIQQKVTIYHYSSLTWAAVVEILESDVNQRHDLVVEIKENIKK